MNHIPGTLTSSKYIFLGSFLTILLESIICIFVPVDKIYAFVKNSSLMVKYIILNIFLLTFISVYTSNISPEYFFQNFYIYFVLIILLLLSFFEIYQSRTQAIEKEKQLDAYTQFLPIVEELITHIRMRQHDFDNELQTLKSLPSICPDYDSLSQNLTSYSEHLSQTTDYSSLLKLNWKLVAGLLFSKEQLAKNSNIDFNIHIINYNLESNIPEYDFIEILGILIDNAFESTKDNGIIHLYMDSIDKKTTIKITNPGYAITPEISASFFSKGYSTKGHNTNSGIGLYKLKTIVDSYHGKIYLYNEKDTAGNTLICFEITA
jgi:sensor histidine kinase regulating citrate/malate metabolism